MLKNFTVYKNDLPDNFESQTRPEGCKEIAIDTETTGLHLRRDRLCVVQISWGDGYGYMVQIEPGYKNKSPNLCKILKDKSITKIFHYGRFDIAVLYNKYNILCKNVFCTKIASYFAMTYTNRHGLKELCRQFAKVDLNKGEQSSYWGGELLTTAQKEYAVSDVLHLHTLKKELLYILEREKRLHLINPCMTFLPHRAMIDLEGWEFDVFAHRWSDT